MGHEAMMAGKMMPICHVFVTKCHVSHKELANEDHVKTQSISILHSGRCEAARCSRGMVKAMCTVTISTLTLSTLLRDPLVQMVMRSDNVSEKDHSDLLYRVRQSLVARSAALDTLMEASVQI
jgi:hypothetical protein